MADPRPSSKRRPAGWSQELVLELLVKPRPLKDQLKELAGPVGLKWSTLYRDIQKWRASDVEFAKEYRAHQRSPSTKGGRPKTVTATDNLANFLIFFRQSGGKIAESCGKCDPPISPGTILELTRPGYDRYDPEFAEEFSKAKLEVLARAQDVPIEVMHDPEMDGRTRAWTALKFLETQDPEHYGRRVDVKHTGTIEHTHSRLSPQQERELLAEHLGAFFRGEPLPILEGECEVVDDAGDSTPTP